MAVDTPEVHAAARAHADAAVRTAALVAALAREAGATGAWAHGGLATVADRFFTTMAWAATTGAQRLTDLEQRLRASADGYDLAEVSAAAEYGPVRRRPGPGGLP